MKNMRAKAPLKLFLPTIGGGMDGAYQQEGARSVSDRALFGRLELGDDWRRLAEACRSTLDAGGMEDSRFKTPAIFDRLEPGAVTMMDYVPEAPVRVADALCPLLKVMGLPTMSAETIEDIDASILYCCGADFHRDAPNWLGSLFLNWYIAGPPRNLVLPGIGAQLIRPGDVFAFDPSQAHAVLPERKRVFDACAYGVYPRGALEDSDGRSPFLASEHSFFAAYVIPMTEDVDKIMGIQRGSLNSFMSRPGWAHIGSGESPWEVNSRTGKPLSPLTISPPRRKAARESQQGFRQTA